MDPALRRREAMIRRLVEVGIRDARVLEAMRRVPRELFVDEALAERAYGDDPLPIGDGQTLSAPGTHARALEALALDGSERVLEVGTGTGYQAALLGHLARELFTIERVARLAERARGILTRLGCDNVTLAQGDGSRGWPDQGPFDAIVAAAVSPEVPRPLVEQLAAGGRMIVPVAAAGGGGQRLVHVRRPGAGADLEIADLGSCRFVPLVGRHGFAAGRRGS